MLTVSDLSDIALVFNFKKPLFQDLNLRKAIAHILDRDKIRDVSVWQANSYENYADGVLKSMEAKWVTQDTLQNLQNITRMWQQQRRF